MIRCVGDRVLLAWDGDRGSHSLNLGKMGGWGVCLVFSEGYYARTLTVPSPRNLEWCRTHRYTLLLEGMGRVKVQKIQQVCMRMAQSCLAQPTVAR
jgi:hypothetical protein